MAAVDKAYIIDHFGNAIDEGLIEPFFQPIYRSMTGKIVCAEALARWHDPELGLLSPADFIPALESSGRIVDLDMHILRRTCAFYNELINRGTPIHSFSVNLSRYDFKDADLHRKITGILAEYNVPHEAIKLEIIESMMLEDIESFQKVFRLFSEDGFTIWIDDFGSGYSSLNVLQNYNFDVMKFDMHFLKNFTAKGRQMLSSLINMGKSLNIHALVEGVETKEQKQFLIASGCEAQQGFFYSKPMSGPDFIALIDTQPDIIESYEDKAYWNSIGQFNFLSASPMEEFADSCNTDPAKDNYTISSGLPLALLECEPNRARYVFANANYLTCIHELGFSSLDDMEEMINDHRSDQYLMLRKMITDSISTNTIQKVEYSNNDVYYRLSTQCLARKDEKAMMAMRLSIFDSDNEEKTAREMLNYGNALFSTYELAVLLYPENDMANRIYTNKILPKYDREKDLKTTVRKFIETEVDPVDQDRYSRFLNFQDIEERLNANSKGFIQGFFRLFLGNSTSSWHTVRVTRIPSSAERIYILTIQNVHGQGAKILGQTIIEHPEMFN